MLLMEVHLTTQMDAPGLKLPTEVPSRCGTKGFSLFFLIFLVRLIELPTEV